MQVEFLLATAVLGLLPLSQGVKPNSPPPGAWTVRGGSLTRSGAVATEPLTGALEVGWSVDLGGRLEGEPRVFGNLVVAVSIPRSGRRELHVLDLLSGEARVPAKAFPTAVDLEPALWERRLVVRSAPNTLRAYRVGSSRLMEEWSYGGDGPVSAPLLEGDELILRDGEALVRVDLTTGNTVWKTEGGFRGDPAADARYVVSLAYPPEVGSGAAYVVRLDRARGSDTGRLTAGMHPGGRAPGVDDASAVALLPDGIFVQHTVSHGDQTGPGILVRGAFGARQTDVLATDLLCAPAAAGAGWLAPLQNSDRERVLALSLGGRDRVLRLADERKHPRFFLPRVPPTVARDVAYVGAQAFDLETTRVRRRSDEPTDRRAVPAGGALLIANGSTLKALRPPQPTRGEGYAEARSWSGRGLAVLASGVVVEGEFVLNDRQLATGGQAWPRADVLWLEAQGKPRWIRSAADVEHGLRAAVSYELAAARADLAEKAAANGDLELAARLAAEARADGYEGRELARVDARLEAGPPARVEVARAARVARDAEDLEASFADRMWARCQALQLTARRSGVPLGLRVELLRSVLGEAPLHPEAGAAVVAHLPEAVRGELSGRVRFDATEWLEFVRASARVPVRVLGPGGPGGDPVARLLNQAARDWRHDVAGFATENLLVVTPLERPGAIARCIAAGELVCRALQETFGGRPRAEDEPLVLWLYPTRQGYLESGAGSEGGSGLEWTAGHYDRVANLSRIYVPGSDEASEGDEATWERVLETYAHELTHHWLRARCPRFPYQPLRAEDADLPGFWIVEGFASMVEEFRFDVEAGTWSPEAPLSQRLDLVAHATPDQLIPWPELFAMSHAEFDARPPGAARTIPTSLYLGKSRTVDDRQLFYAQAAAVCRELYASSGGRRALLDYVTDYYTADADGLAVARAFHRDANKLGAEAVAHARAVLDVGGR